MELQRLERQRIRLYKQQLKEEMEKRSNQRAEENAYQRRRQSKDMNELIDRLNKDDIRRMQERKQTQLLLKQHNEQISHLRRSGYSQDIQRITKQREEVRNQKQQNKVQGGLRKRHQGEIVQIQRQEELKHVQRMAQIAEDNKKQYEEIKKRHVQNMNIYDKHSQLVHDNDQYKRLSEKFTQVDNDILSHLYRDQYAQRIRDSQRTQEVLKNQMEEYKEKRAIEKSQILEGNDLEKSIFHGLLRNSSQNKKAYGQELKNQMSEVDQRRSMENKNLKEKYQIHGIFGGQHGRDRKYQIQYVDRKMGFLDDKPKINNTTVVKNVTPSENKNKIRTSYNQNLEEQTRQVNNERVRYQEAQKIARTSDTTAAKNIGNAKFTAEELRKFEKRYQEEEKQKIFANQRERRNRQTQARQKMSQSMHLDESPGVAKTPRYESKERRELPRQYSQYEGYLSNKGNQLRQEQQQQYLPSQSPEQQQPSRHQAQDRKVFRSFDLVTGRSRYYA